MVIAKTIIAAGLLLAFCGGGATAGELRLSGVLPGGGLLHKPVVSVKEARFSNLIRQETDFSCGAASLATILKYACGRDVTERQILIDMVKVSDPKEIARRGFSLLELKKYAETIGMEGLGFQVPRENLPKIKMPTIVLIDIEGYKHFVVLKTVRDEVAYLADPALGNTSMTLDEFMASWNGIVFAVVGADYDAETVLTEPIKTASAREHLGDYAPFATIETREYGTIGAGYLDF